MKRSALVLAVLVLAGCSGAADEEGDFEVPLVCSPDVDRLPCAAGVEPGREYRFSLLTHCGVEWAYLDGRYWVPRPQVDPPSDWAGIEGGTIVLRGQEEALFTADQGGGARFEPARSGYRPEPCA